ncbi:hypothetical protein MUN74_06050 [Agromyces endophyticus]|uniref:hypothetical protein n=1 Tax=Agromyces sp. H17E-10 TaxID=2932244 RepID=UPI001FD30E11|nr:hypothetical protein [Agromyces sp. H17E-10]UOQ90475.1 hypothetical protein MUN74_06050 [Agromyces sp. H17E-10]
MTGDDAELEARADALRRVVYGTPDGYETDAATELERVEAELARRAEERRDAASRSLALDGGAAAASASSGAASVSNSGDPRDTPFGDDADPARRLEHPESHTAAAQAGAQASRTPKRRWPTVLAIAGVAVAFAAAGAVAIASLVAPPRGLAVFDRPQQPEDESLVVALGAQADTVRKLDELFGRGFWGYLNGADQVCLSVVPIGGPNIVERGECASRDRFAEHGIAVQYVVAELGAFRPRGAGDRDVLIVSWLPDHEDLDWELVMIDPPPGDRQTYEEWSSAHDAG